MGNTQFAVDWESRVDFVRLRQDRLRKTRKGMESSNINALLLFKPTNIRYAAGAKGIESYWDISECAIIHLEEPPIAYLSPGIGLEAPWLDGKLRQAVNLHGEGKVGREVLTTFIAEVASIIPPGEDFTLGIDILSPSLYRELASKRYKIVDAGPALTFARARKTPDEIALLKVAAAMNDGAFHACKETIKPGVRETDISSAMVAKLRQLGSDWPIRGVICSGDHTSPQYKSVGGTDRIIQPGDFVLVDMVHSYMSYWSDVARTFMCGEDPSKRQKTAYRECYEMLQAGVELIKPGNSTSDVISCWEEFKTKSDVYNFGVGHGIGTTLHEIPIIDKASMQEPTEFIPNMVLALEVYSSNGVEGIRLEQNIVVTEEGHEIISKYPFEESLMG